MTTYSLTLRSAIVLLLAVVYWGGVAVNAFRIRRRTGQSPNVSPKNLKEKLLWLGWFLVIAGWIGQPLVLMNGNESNLFSISYILYNPFGFTVGLLLIGFGYSGTLWCYAILGMSWRMGVDQSERTPLIVHGPYRLMRHPIYLFQAMILVGTGLLLPTIFSLIIILLNILCIWIKSVDEENYLLKTHGAEYQNYLSRTGRFFIPIFRLRKRF